MPYLTSPILDLVWQDSGMWQDALRVCKEYVPHKLQQLQDEYDREMTAESTRWATHGAAGLSFEKS